jgi:hypothetical protein
MLSKIYKGVSNRQTAKDVFYTPDKLAKRCIDMMDDSGIWYEPFDGNSAFSKQFPITEYYTTEIQKGTDFFETHEFDSKITHISTNPPYSVLRKIWDELCSNRFPKLKQIGLLLGIHNITSPRIKRLNEKGFFIKSMFMCNVWKWFGMSIFIVFDNSINKNLFDVGGVYYSNERLKKQKIAKNKNKK